MCMSSLYEMLRKHNGTKIRTQIQKFSGIGGFQCKKSCQYFEHAPIDCCPRKVTLEI